MAHLREDGYLVYELVDLPLDRDLGLLDSHDVQVRQDSLVDRAMPSSANLASLVEIVGDLLHLCQGDNHPPGDVRLLIYKLLQQVPAVLLEELLSLHLFPPMLQLPGQENGTKYQQ